MRFSFITAAAATFIGRCRTIRRRSSEESRLGSIGVESNEPAPRVRIREDATALLSGDGNGRTYYIGVAGAGSGLGPLRFAASAEASLVRESSCHLVIGDMHAGDRIDGYLD